MKWGGGPEFLRDRRDTAKRDRSSIFLLDAAPIVPATEYPTSGGTEWKKRRSRMHSGQTVKCIHAAEIMNRDWARNETSSRILRHLQV